MPKFHTNTGENFVPNNYSNIDCSGDLSAEFVDPYYLHHIDNPGTLPVCKPLTEDHYAIWIQSTSVLVAKN